MADSIAPYNDMLAQQIEEAMAYAYSRGFNAADANPRQPESMGR